MCYKIQQLSAIFAHSCKISSLGVSTLNSNRWGAVIDNVVSKTLFLGVVTYPSKFSRMAAFTDHRHVHKLAFNRSRKLSEFVKLISIGIAVLSQSTNVTDRRAYKNTGIGVTLCRSQVRRFKRHAIGQRNTFSCQHLTVFIFPFHTRHRSRSFVAISGVSIVSFPSARCVNTT